MYKCLKTNLTIDDDNIDSILVDSGFSGLAVVGSATLERMTAGGLLALRGGQCKASNTYTFGAGDRIKADCKQQVEGERIGRVHVDVVPGKLPFLIGREFCRRKKILLDFDKNKVTVRGESTSPAHIIRLSPVSPLAGVADVQKQLPYGAVPEVHAGTGDDPGAVAASGGVAEGSVERRPVKEGLTDRSESSSTARPAAADVRKGRVRGGDRVRITDTTEVVVPGRDGEKLTKEFKVDQRCKDPLCDEAGCIDINVFAALAEYPDRELELAVIGGMLKNVPSHSPPDGDSLAPLRERSGSARLLSKAKADELNRRYPSPVWNIRAGFIRRLHLLRHAPASSIRKFIWHVLPIQARQHAAQDCKHFCDVIEQYAKAVVKNCLGCALNTKKISRPIGISVVAPWAVGMVDTMCLNHDQQWYALVVADLGTGVSWAFPIRERFPPDSAAAFSTYVSRWASIFSPHGKLIMDRAAIFANPAAMQLWESLGIVRETVGSYAHFSMGSVERKIGVLRYSIDRIRDSGSSPNSIDGWEICLAVICNALFNDVDVSGTTPSTRVFGRTTSILRNALTDTLATSNEDTTPLLEVAEHAQVVYEQAKADRKLRNLLNSHLPPGSEEPPFPAGTKVAYYQEGDGSGRNIGRHGPAEVICLDSENRYVLKHGSSIVYSDRIHVIAWPGAEQDAPPAVTGDPPGPPGGPAPIRGADVPAIADAPADAPGAIVPSPYDPVDSDDDVGERTASGDMEIDRIAGLIHNPAHETVDQARITCGKCKNPRSHHGHKRDKQGNPLPCCRLYWRARERTRAVAEAKEVVNCIYAAKCTRLEDEDWASTVATEGDYGVITAADLENIHNEDFQYIADVGESTYFYEVLSATDDPIADQTESKYLYSWEDLDEDQKKDAIARAIKAYDDHDSWDKKNPLSTEEVLALRRKNPKIVLLDSIVVKDAKIKNTLLIGKVRITPRGFRDTSDKARFFSTSPTVSSATIRLAEMLGMMYGLTSWLFDITDAFFLGERLLDDEIVYLKLPAEIDPKQPWLRLLREVPGCRGASSSWYRTLSRKLLSWGWEMATTDKALFMKRDQGGKLCGILPVHVDDGKLRATKECAEELFACFEKAGVKLGTVDKQEYGTPYEFTGLQFIETADGERINQNLYITNKLRPIDAEVASIGKTTAEDTLLDKPLAKVFGTTIGRLIWVMPTQVRHCYEISLMSRYRSCPRVKHIRRLSKLVNAIRAAPGEIFLPRFNPKLPLKIVTVVDAGEGEQTDEPIKLRDHQCVMILLAQPDGMTVKASTRQPVGGGPPTFKPGVPMRVGLVVMQSVGIARVTHSSFDSESLVAVSAIDVVGNVRDVGGEIVMGPCPPLRDPERPLWVGRLWGIEMHSDSMSLCKVIRLGIGASLSRRRQRDVEDLRQFVTLDGAAFIHIDGPTNPTDVGTKPASRTDKAMRILSKIVDTGKYQAQISQNFKDTFVTKAEELASLHSVYSTVVMKKNAPLLERVRIRLLFC